MDANNRVRSPIGRFGRRWSIWTRCRTVLGSAAHIVAETPPLDLLPLLEADHWVQVVLTVLASRKLREHDRRARGTAGDRTLVAVDRLDEPGGGR